MKSNSEEEIEKCTQAMIFQVGWQAELIESTNSEV